VGNKMDGETYGIELAIDWHPLDWWHFEAAYSYLQIQLHIDEDSTDMISENEEGESPHNKFSLRSSMELGKNVEFDLWLRYVDNLSGRGIDNYITLDSRLGWQPSKNFELSIVGQNLLDSQHPEFGTPLFINTFPTEVERSVYGKLTWRF
ncbi:MAG: TonB-dependent receptor domain-containing protein, partial [Planctomycetota bacterium]